VADRQGRLHIFWQVENAIFYCYLDGKVWSEKNDVIATAEDQPFIIGPVLIDHNDYFNLLWTDQGKTRSLFLSRAHVAVAQRPQSWQTQTLYSPAVSMWGAHMEVDGEGKLHVVYAPDGRWIHYVVSADDGMTWSPPIAIWAVEQPEKEAVLDPRIAVDPKGYIHVVWTLTSVDRSWQGIAVYYARSTDGGQTWDVAEVQRSTEANTTVASINIAIRNETEVHLVWNRGIASPDGRYHSWSTDNGDTWTPPASFLPAWVNGQAGLPLMVVDTAQTLHLVTLAQGGQVQNESMCTSTSGCAAPKYTFWNGQNWSPMYEFPEGSSDSMIALAMSLGNTVYLIHPERRGGGQLLYNTLVTDAPPVQPQEIPVLLPTPKASITPTPDIRLEETMRGPIESITNYAASGPQQRITDNPVAPLVISTFSVFLVILSIVFWRLNRSHKTRWR